MHAHAVHPSFIVTLIHIQLGDQVFFFFKSIGCSHSARGVHKVAKWRVSCLDGEVAQEGGVGLDAVPLFIIIGEVEQFKGQVCPHSMHPLTVQLTYVHHLILKCQHTSCVHILQE